MNHGKDCDCEICREGMTRFLAKLDANVAEHGRSVISVWSDGKGPAFTYTVGNTTRGLPEILIVGASGPAFTGILNAVSKKLAERPDPMVEGLLDIGGKFSPYLLPASDEVKNRYTRFAGRYGDYAVLQLVICDPQGRFPWDDGCAKPYRDVQIYRRLNG